VFITGGIYQLSRVNEGLGPLSAPAVQRARHEPQEYRTRKAAAPQRVQLSFDHFEHSRDLNSAKRNYSGLTVGLMNAAKYMEGVNSSHS